jgi:hypothetical protein
MRHPIPTALALATLLAVGCQPPSQSTVLQRLDDGWEFRRGDARETSDIPGHLTDILNTWLPASVPGTVHTDLLTQGLSGGDGVPRAGYLR